MTTIINKNTSGDCCEDQWSDRERGDGKYRVSQSMFLKTFVFQPHLVLVRNAEPQVPLQTR